MKHNDKVYIHLDRDRELILRHREIKRLQAIYHVETSEIDTTRLDAETTEKIMYVMLERDAKDHGEELTLPQVAELLDLTKPGEIIRKMTACFVTAYAPDDDPEAKTDEKAMEKTENPTNPAA